MSSMPREALNTNASKPGVIGVVELDAQRLGARDHFLRIGNVGRRDLVHHVGGRVAQHAFGADVEDLNDALRVGGDTREVGAVENRALQGTRLEQRLFGLLARGDITQNAGEVTLATQPHFAYRHLHRENAAILAPAHDLASEADGARLIARTVILEGTIACWSRSSSGISRLKFCPMSSAAV